MSDTPTREVARAVGADSTSEYQVQPVQQVDMLPPMKDIISRYASWLRSEGAAESTVKQRLRFARVCHEQWGGSYRSVTVEQVRELIAQPGQAKWTRSTYYGHLRSLFKFLCEVGEVAEDLTEVVTRPRPPRPAPRPLSAEELDRVLRTARGIRREWVELALYAGLRAHEIAKIRGEDVTEEAIYVEGKGGVQAFIPTHPKLVELAARKPATGAWYPSYSGSGTVTAGSVSRSITYLFRSLGIEGSCHRLRHNFGTGLVDAGNALTVVSSLMRHQSLNTTAIYIDVRDRDKRAAIANLSFDSGVELVERRRAVAARGRSSARTCQGRRASGSPAA